MPFRRRYIGWPFFKINPDSFHQTEFLADSEVVNRNFRNTRGFLQTGSLALLPDYHQPGSQTQRVVVLSSSCKSFEPDLIFPESIFTLAVNVEQAASLVNLVSR